MKKYRCKCCGNYTIKDEPLDPNIYPGTFEICPVCFWEDDSLQFLKSNMEGGANRVSLNQAQKNYLEFGASERRFLSFVRPPRKDELPENNK